MKKYISLSILSLCIALSSCNTEVKIEKSESKTKDQTQEVPGNYGAEISEMEALTPSQLVSQLQNGESFEGQIMGEINEVCTKKGCWLTMDLPDGESMRVTFKDYGFFVPTNSHGFPIILEGVATIVETDVETLRHFAEDQGKSQEEIEKITAPKREITFEATGVVIKDKA